MTWEVPSFPAVKSVFQSGLSASIREVYDRLFFPFLGQVLYYLTRIEPFTTLSIQLQGGKFDHADRMFSDIGATWNGVLEDMSDVKELVCI